MSNNGKLLNESYEASIQDMHKYNSKMEESYKALEESKSNEKINIMREYAKASLHGMMDAYYDTKDEEFVARRAWVLAEAMYEEEQKRR